VVSVLLLILKSWDLFYSKNIIKVQECSDKTIVVSLGVDFSECVLLNRRFRKNNATAANNKISITTGMPVYCNE
jgi:hypothetical protein